MRLSPPCCFDGRVHGASSEAPSSLAGFFTRLELRGLEQPQLPGPVPGTNLRKPAGWQARDTQKYRNRRSATPVSRPLRANGITTSP